MENKNVNPVDILALCQTELGDVPFTLKDQNTVGNRLSKVIIWLEEAKKAIQEHYILKDSDQNGSEV